MHVKLQELLEYIPPHIVVNELLPYLVRESPDKLKKRENDHYFEKSVNILVNMLGYVLDSFLWRSLSLALVVESRS